MYSTMYMHVAIIGLLVIPRPLHGCVPSANLLTSNLLLMHNYMYRRYQRLLLPVVRVVLGCQLKVTQLITVTTVHCVLPEPE